MSAVSQREQCIEALQIANQIKQACADYKQQVFRLSYRDGHLKVAGLLDEPVEGPLGSMKVGQLLGSIRRMGEAKTMVLCHRAGIFSPQRRLRALTVRQRLALAAALRDQVA